MRTSLLAALLAFSATALMAQEPVDYVDPFIGTTNFSVCNPGAVLPQGMMSVVPFNVMGSDLNPNDKDARWWSAPYEYHNKYFTGFAHVTLSGVGCPELGSLLLRRQPEEIRHSMRSDFHVALIGRAIYLPQGRGACAAECGRCTFKRGGRYGETCERHRD